MHFLTRRDWLATVGATCGAKRVLSKTLSENQSIPESGIVDAHVHVWSEDFRRYPLADGFTGRDLWFPGYSSEEVSRLGRQAGVTRFNLVQMTWYGLDHSYICDVIARDPDHFVGTGVVPAVVDVALADPGRMMVDLSQRGVYAFRIRGRSTRPKVSAGQRWMDFSGFEKMFTTAAKYNLALSFLMSPPDLPEIDRMCGSHADTPVILDHFALVGRQMMFVEDEIRALCAMAKHHRVMVKLGGFYSLGDKTPPYRDMLPLIQRVVDAFGPERCMWESDAPLQTKNGHTFEAAVAVIRDHADFLSVSDRHQILVKTAENFFFNRS